MFRRYLNLHHLWMFSSGLPVFRRPVHVTPSKKGIYNVSPHLCEHAGLFIFSLRHPSAEKLTYKQTKRFAHFGYFWIENHFTLFQCVYSQSIRNASFASFVSYSAHGWRTQDLNIPACSSGLGEANCMQKPDGKHPYNWTRTLTWHGGQVPSMYVHLEYFMTWRYLKVTQGPYKSFIKVLQVVIISECCHITCLSLFRVP